MFEVYTRAKIDPGAPHKTLRRRDESIASHTINIAPLTDGSMPPALHCRLVGGLHITLI